MRKLVSIFVIILVLSLAVTAQENLKPKFNLKFGESLEATVEMGEQFRIRAREQSQIDLTINGDQGTGNFKIIIDEITTDKLTVRTSVNGEKFKVEELSTNNVLKGSENHYKVNLYGGNAPEILLRPEITNANGEKEERSTVIFFNIYSAPIPGRLPEKKEVKKEEVKEESNVLLWGVLIVLAVILLIVFTRKKGRQQHNIEKVETPVVDIKEEHKAIEEPKKKVKKKTVTKKAVKKKSSK